jgi:hypothetical protein
MVEQMLDDPAAEKASPTEDSDELPASELSRFQSLRHDAERAFQISEFYPLTTDNSKRACAVICVIQFTRRRGNALCILWCQDCSARPA